MAFTPTPPPPNAQQVAQIAEALCARAEARERASQEATIKRGSLWRKELLSLRNTAPPPKTPVQTTGPAAVMEARLARICPPVKTVPKVVKPVEQLSQERIELYNQRMALHFTPVSAISKTTASAPRETKSEAPVPKPRQAPKSQKRSVPPTLKRMEPVLAAAPPRKAITPMPVKPMLKGVKPTMETAAKPSVNEEQEEVPRPSFIEFLISAYINFRDRMKKQDPNDQKKAPEAEAVAW